MTVPTAQCVHKTAGRFRLKIPSAKGNEPVLAAIQEQISRSPQVSSASANVVTGTLLVMHKGEMRTVTSYAEKHSLFKLAPAKGSPLSVARATVEGYKTANRRVLKFSGGEINLPDAAVLTLVGTSLLQMARGRLRAPPWYTALWYAVNIFQQAHKSREGKK